MVGGVLGGWTDLPNRLKGLLSLMGLQTWCMSSPHTTSAQACDCSPGSTLLDTPATKVSVSMNCSIIPHHKHAGNGGLRSEVSE